MILFFSLLFSEGHSYVHNLKSCKVHTFKSNFVEIFVTIVSVIMLQVFHG